ncbi:MAG: hypothetical protein PF488_03565 [Patescibacteria group bacterium]|jgi:hypothetical protein|nr:hypothetical protein [Patescibacteria group bacterium]
MVFGENAKNVFILIMEFVDSIDKIEPKKSKEIKGKSGFFHLISLHEISRTFIVKPEFREESIFNAVNDIYNSKNGIEKFIFFKKTLLKEKELGFCNLALITKNKIEQDSNL